MKRGLFITLEGLEGVGKTSNREFIEELLNKAGIDFVSSREPGGTAIGEKLRNLVLHDGGEIQARTELLLMTASRCEHVAQLIEPALSSGRWVLCDRFADASFAYQGGGRALGAQLVEDLHHLMGVGLRPDLTLLLDMSIEAGLARMAARGKPDRIEQEAFEFFERAREAYRARAKADPERIKLIDASLPLEDVKMSVGQEVQALIDSASTVTSRQ